MSDMSRARGYFYESFANAFTLIEEKDFLLMQEQFKTLKDFALNEEQELAFNEILTVDFKRFKVEQNAIFYDFSFANVPLSASFYDEGVENGKMRVKACELLHKSNFRLNQNINEDEFSVLFSLCGMLLQNDNEELASDVFKQILNEVIDEFVEKFSNKEGSIFFKNLSIIMKVFFELERTILDIKAPVHEYSKADIALAKTPYTPRMATKFSKINLEEVTEFKGMD